MKDLVWMEKIRILTVVDNISKCDGIASYVMNYYRKFNRLKIYMDFVVVSKNIDDEYKKTIIDMGSKIFYINSPKSVGITKYIKEVKEFLEENAINYDIIHSHVINIGYFFLKYAKKYGIKTRVLHSHNTTLGSNNPVKKIRNKIFANLACKLSTNRFACSTTAGKYLFKNKNFIVIHNAIEPEDYKFNEKTRKEYRDELGINDDIVMIHIGRFDIQKNHIFLLETLKKINEVDKRYKLILIGTGILEEDIKRKIDELNLSEHVLMLGKRSDVGNILCASDIFLLPSLFEGLGIVAIEAQNSDIYCILSDRVPNEVKIIEKVDFLSLDSDKWKNRILNIDLEKIRNDRMKDIRNSGYDINVEVLNLQKIYSSIISSN